MRTFVRFQTAVRVRMNLDEIRNEHPTFYGQMAGGESFELFNAIAMSTDAQAVKIARPGGGEVELPRKAIAFLNWEDLRNALAQAQAPKPVPVVDLTSTPARVAT